MWHKKTKKQQGLSPCRHEDSPFLMLCIASSRLLGLLLDDAALFDAGLLTREFAQIVQFGATHLTVLVNHDVVDERRLNGENTLHTDVVANLANGETLLLALAHDLDDHAAILLNTLLVTLLDAISHRDGVAREELGMLLASGKCLLCNFN